jgi:small GTP-binding protein
MGKKEKKEDKIKKILLLGLDNAGKSSIYLMLSKNANLLSYCSLHPTQGLDIKTLDDAGDSYSIWDFGGQAEYRAQYLEKMQEHLTGVDKIIYVIDVQDVSRYGESLAYLQDITNYIKQEKQNFVFSIFLHKFDKNLDGNAQFRDEAIKENLVDKIDEILGDVYHEIFKTTIFTLFQKTKMV